MAAKDSRQIKKVIDSVAGLLVWRFNRRAMPTALNYKPIVADLSTLPTGLRPLDKALEIGGLPYGRITELISPGTSGNAGATSVAARIASKAQRKQHMVTIIDMSHSFDTWQAERSGLIAPHLLLARPDTVFEALSTLENAARHEEGLVVVVMGIVSELLSHADIALLRTLLGRLRTIIKQSNNVFLFMTSPPNNDPFSPTNYPIGFPLAELAEVRLWIQDETWSHKDGIATAYKATLAVIKNSLAMPGKGANVTIKFTNPVFFGD